MAGLIPGPMEARASFISYPSKEIEKLDQESLETLRIVLENQLIAEKLFELGLSSEEIIHSIEQLSPEERQVVLENLQSVQVGGADVFSILLAGMIIGFLLQVFLFPLLIIAELAEKKKVKEVKGVREEMEGRPYIESFSLYDSTDNDFMPFEGEIKVLKGDENVLDLEKGILIGRIEVIGSGTMEEVLELFKKEAANLGADTLILKSEPKQMNEGYLFWSGRAYKTKDVESGK
jgi:hypothetical protein